MLCIRQNRKCFLSCYAATAILAESFDEKDKRKMCKWIEIYKNIIYGYDKIAKLSCEEKRAVPYVVLSNQLIATAWFAGKEKYKELYVVNMKMTKWILENFDEVKKLF